MLAIDNTNLKNDCCNAIAGFTPKVKAVIDAALKTVTVTDETTYPAGDGLKKLVVKIHDQFGGTVEGTTGAAISIATLNLAKPINITGTVNTTDNLVADGSAYGLSGSQTIYLSNWDAQKA